MDAQQDLLKAAEDFRQHVAANGDDDEGPAGEYKAAEYIIFTLALDVYTRHLEETIEFYLARKQEKLNFALEGRLDEDPHALESEISKLEQHAENPTDKVVKAGVQLLKRLDRDLETFQKFMSENLPGKPQQAMLNRTLRKPARSSEGAGLRAQGLKGLLNIGGSKTIRGIFDTQKLRKQINDAIVASKIADGDAALDKFAAMPVRNALIRKWLDWAAKVAKPLMAEGITPDKLVNPVQEASIEVAEPAAEVMVQQAQQMGTTGADEAQEAQEVQQAALTTVEQAAAQKASEALEKSGEPDEPPVRSEVVGIATAAAVAAMSDVSNPRNVPESLKKLDDEQLAAALTDGKVLIAAGAGAGKSTTLIARSDYLVRDREVDPERMLVTSFNTKAADELGEKLDDKLGSGAPKHVGTMHSMFGSFVRKYGTDRERAAMGDFKKVEGETSRAVQGIWKDCFPDEPAPSAKMMKLAKTQWAGNNVSPRDAIASAETAEEIQAAKWYEMYEGLKGSLDQDLGDGEVIPWEPSCESKAQTAVDDVNQEKTDRWVSMGSKERFKPKAVKTTFEAYKAKNRPGDKRIADFDDMLKMCHDVLERDKGARKAIQNRFDHIMVDECQDLNEIQHGIIRMMSEHITDGEDGKSLWMVGDDKQSIYAFRGARPDLFIELDGKEGWKTCVIRTNYRCAPEIVDAANKLIAHNEDQIPMEANANPAKPTGVASIKVDTPPTDAAAAISTIEEIKLRAQDLTDAELGDFLKENAVLLRTNKEIHAYETACIIRGIPYARKGSGSFLGSRETGAMLGYMDLIMGGADDPKDMQKALAKCINEPNRFYTGSQTEAKTEEAIRKYAQKTKSYIKDVDPSKLMDDPTFQQALAETFGGTSDWRARKAMEKIHAMAGTIQDIRTIVDEPDFTTKDLFDEILGGFEGETDGTDDDGVPVKVTQSLRAALEVNIRDYSAAGDAADDEGDEEDDAAKLGNIGFLYMLMKPDPTDPEDTVQSPQTPKGFKSKMGRLGRRSEDLRYNLDWNPKDGDKTDKMANLSKKDRKKPPAVFLGTIHSVKGAEWPTTYVQMPAGIFPYEHPPPKEGDPPITEAELAKRAAELETERRLAYVAITRAEEKLTIICPKKVGGRDAGGSQFVGEAGLSPGENVPETGLLEEPGVDAETKVATDHYIGQFAPPEDPTPWDPSDFEGGQ